jgi:hypothetical protein
MPYIEEPLVAKNRIISALGSFHGVAARPPAMHLSLDATAIVCMIFVFFGGLLYHKYLIG